MRSPDALVHKADRAAERGAFSRAGRLYELAFRTDHDYYRAFRSASQASRMYERAMPSDDSVWTTMIAFGIVPFPGATMFIPPSDFMASTAKKTIEHINKVRLLEKAMRMAYVANEGDRVRELNAEIRRLKEQRG